MRRQRAGEPPQAGAGARRIGTSNVRSRGSTGRSAALVGTTSTRTGGSVSSAGSPSAAASSAVADTIPGLKRGFVLGRGIVVPARRGDPRPDGLRLGHDRHGDRAAHGLLLRDDLRGQAREPRHVEEAEPDPEPRQLVGAHPAKLPAGGDGAHLVIQLRPADATAAVAEPHEFDRVGVRRVQARAVSLHR